MAVDRRQFLRGGAATLALSTFSWTGCASWPLGAERAAPGGAFQHGVASGDPLADRVILWTRVTPESGDVPFVLVDWVLARDPALRDVVARGTAPALATRDFTLKLDPTGLEPQTTYYYHFQALGQDSPVGRTRTLPLETEHVRLAFCSCSNIAFGFFNAYAALAAADVDAVLHLGDYLYEYANGSYGDGTALGRVPEPDLELVTLAHYRTRHAQYKRDPDAQAAHARHPFITVWDDHESADNAWVGGAHNHQESQGEGSWLERKAAAMRAYREWMPIREVPADRSGRIYRSFRYGELVDLIMLDTRLVGRDEQLHRKEREALADPRRSLLGGPQEAWLLDELTRSRREGVAWRVLGQQVMFAQLVGEEGLIRNPDAWDGYPESRRRLFAHLASNGIDDVVVLTGDVHSSWANELSPDPFASPPAAALAVEFVTPGVSSPSPARPDRADALARNAVETHPHIKWVDLSHRGYALLDIRPERVRCEWWFSRTVEERDASHDLGAAWVVSRGSARLEPA